MTDRLAGKVALITGGARGIGLTMSEMFAAEGACVIMAGRNADAGGEAEAEIRRAGGRATFVQTDVADRKQMEAAVDTAVSTYGSLTILVNNATHVDAGMGGGVAVCEPEAWDQLINVDLGGVYNACHFSVPAMIEAGGGSIISMGSATAINGQAHLSAHMAAKLGITGLMRSIAVDYGKDLVRANMLTLGIVPHDKYSIFGSGELGKAFLSVTSLPFLGEPRDAGYAAIYLASDESRWVTGTELLVSGGMTRVPDLRPLMSDQTGFQK